jgi:23S rRNA G2445 N2-methylase RlmL
LHDLEHFILQRQHEGQELKQEDVIERNKKCKERLDQLKQHIQTVSEEFLTSKDTIVEAQNKAQKYLSRVATSGNNVNLRLVLKELNWKIQ